MILVSRHKSIVFFILFTLLNLSAYSQKAYPRDYFRPPLDIRLLLSGTFGEIRSNHFHSGIDIKTGGMEGAEIYAIANGYVSRIKVSAYGFGKAIYITHPNGFVSVYGHLSRYNNTIGDYIRTAQYARESFEIELFPTDEELKVKKGEVIAYSGNSGSSGGPHLHFEIRDAGSQKPVNPLLFGYEVKDFFKPRITAIKIYPEDYNSLVNGKSVAKFYPVEGWGTEHKITGNPAIKLSGKISFAVQTFDQQNDTDNKNGPYSVALFIDGKLVSGHNMESFSFDDTRYVNSLLDYKEFIQNSTRLQRTKIDPGNKLDIYKGTINKGIFLFNDTLIHNIRYEVADAAGNTAMLEFKVKSDKQGNSAGQVTGNAKTGQTPRFPVSDFKYDIPNRYENRSVILDAPAGVFYDSFLFTYDTSRQIAGTFSPVHKIHDKYTPVHDNIILSIRPSGLPADLQDKALIVKVKDDGKSYSPAGGKYERGYIVTKIKEFGNYSIAVDTIPPKIKPVNPEVFTKMAGQKMVKLTISDNLSGISGYRGSLNGRWILLEYDAKNDMFTYFIDESLVPGKNTLLIEVTDGKNNRSFFAATLIL
jgi:murein DD-endopeptidase MepM/ murein hydrolase activator NlpD